MNYAQRGLVKILAGWLTYCAFCGSWSETKVCQTCGRPLSRDRDSQVIS